MVLWTNGLTKYKSDWGSCHGNGAAGIIYFDVRDVLAALLLFPPSEGSEGILSMNKKAVTRLLQLTDNLSIKNGSRPTRKKTCKNRVRITRP